MCVDQLECAIEVRHANNAKHWAEDLLTIDGHFGLDVVEQTAAQEETALITGDLGTAPIDDQLRAFHEAFGDIAADLVEVLPRHQRSHLGLLVATRVDLETARALCQ